MVKRVAIVVASLAATAVLTVGFVVAGFAPRPAEVEPVAVSADLIDIPLLDMEPGTARAVETVYVEPAATPRVVRIRERASVATISNSSGRGSRLSGRSHDLDDDRGEDREDDGHEDHEDHREDDGHEDEPEDHEDDD